MPVDMIMNKLLKDGTFDGIIAAIPKEEQQERLKQLFHRKTIAELLELYPNWCINEMAEPDEVSSTCLEGHATLTIPSYDNVFYTLDDRPHGHVEQTSSVH